MAFMKGSHNRRSDRLMFTVPLCIEGLTQTGEPFECNGHTVAVNRFGAHVRLEQPISISNKFFLTNLKNKLRGEFRIVRVLENPSGEKTDYAVEALGSYPTFWGIEFPSQPAKPGESRGLLECQQCRSVTLYPLLLDEIEGLESGGMVRKPCASCGSKTEWKFAMGGSHAALPEPGLATENPLALPGEKQQGKHLVFMQRPVSIRTAAGQIETLQTENLSKDEIRCASIKNYEVNQIVTLEWENSGTGQRLQVRARVRRRQSIAGSRRVVYSIQYEGSPAVLPPTPLKPARNFYVAMGALVAAASLLLEINVRGLVTSLKFPVNSTAPRVATLGAVLLLVALAHMTWKTILAREPESRRLFKSRHRIAASLATIAFLGSLGAGAIDGMGRGDQRQQTLTVLRDFAMARVFERNIDAAENRVTNSPADYTDICSTLHLLARQWEMQLDEIAADSLKLHHTGLWHNARLDKEMNGLQEILTLDRRKLGLVQTQVSLESQAKTIDSDKQQAFWQSSFQPLRQQILDLNARKAQVVKTLVAER